MPETKMLTKFPSLAAFQTAQAEDALTKGRTRLFFLEKEMPFLIVKGIIRVDRVQIGPAIIPEFHTRQVVRDRSMKTLDDETHKLWGLQMLDEETPILVRSMISAYGKWPSNVTIRVTGEWDESKVEEPEDVVEQRPVVQKKQPISAVRQRAMA